jgi:hypothetical protein
MEVLKFNFMIAFILLVTSCGEPTSTTQVIMLRSDTFISSNNSSNNTELPYLKLSKTSSSEDRILLRLPTNDHDDDFFDGCFEGGGLCNIFFLPITIVTRILSNCDDSELEPDNLTSAVLMLDTNDSSSISAGSLNLNLLSKPWWHSANWTKAHPFSKKGKWSTPGGDMDMTISFDTNCNNLSDGSCTAGEIKFELTSFFKTLLANKSRHYGLIISANSPLTASQIYSVQAGSNLSPRIVATYTCSSSFVPETKTFYFGAQP